MTSALANGLLDEYHSAFDMLTPLKTSQNAYALNESHLHLSAK